MKHLSLFVPAALVALAACTSNQKNTIVVENPSDRTRMEIVSVPCSLVCAAVEDPQQLVITDAQGLQVPYQKTSDGELIFKANVPASTSATYYIKQGKADEFATVATGKQYPERVDDIAWENDRIAFRAYGPALQATGERAFGYDVWVKSCDNPVVEARYAMELNPATLAAIDSLKTADPDSAAALRAATSYHVDHGNGLDCYKVGPTLGGGTAALMDGGSIVYPYCYKNFEILDNGPLRFAVRLTYGPIVVGGKEVVETRTITLDAGSQLNKTVVEYAGLDKSATIVAGPVLHDKDGGTYAANAEKGYVGYADPTDNPANNNGTIYVGAVVPAAVEKADKVLFGEAEAAERGAEGHVLCFSTYNPGDKFVYYWGGGWSKYGFDSFEAWEKYLGDFADNLKQPLKATVR